MADITIYSITPRHFYESVKLFKEFSPKFYFSENSLTVDFGKCGRDVSGDLYHLRCFLLELSLSSVPVDLDEFVKTYMRTPSRRFFKR